MVDEFDRVADEATRTRLADTIKVLSDRAAPIQFIILGVSENLEELLGRHPSIQRNVVGVPLPLLTDAEIESLLDQGARDSGLRFAPPVQEAIVALSRVDLNGAPPSAFDETPVNDLDALQQRGTLDPQVDLVSVRRVAILNKVSALIVP